MPNNGLTISDGFTTLDHYVELFREEEPRVTGQAQLSFNQTLRSSVRDEARRFRAVIPRISKSAYQAILAMIKERAVVTVSGEALLNEEITAIITASYELVGITTPVDGVAFLYTVTLQIEQVEATATEPATNSYSFPGLSDHEVALGSITSFNGAAKVSLIVWMTCIRTGAQQALFSRYDDLTGGTSRQFFFGFTSDQKLLTQISAGGSNLSTPTSTAARLTAGKTYKLALVYDGTQGTANNRVKMYYAERNDTTLAFPAVSVDAIDYFGTALATALTSPAAVQAKLGGTVNTDNSFGGFQHAVRLWVGTALSEAQINAETLDDSPVPATHEWPMNSSVQLNDTGSTGGFNGTPTFLVVPAQFEQA